MSILTDHIVKDTWLDYYGITIVVRPIRNAFEVRVTQCQDRLAKYCRVVPESFPSLEEALDHIATTLEPPREVVDYDDD